MTAEEIQRARPAVVRKYREDLVNKQKTMGRFHTKFLDSLERTQMTEEDTNTPEWVLWRKMKEEYDRIDALIRTANFYLGDTPRFPSVPNA